MGKFLFKETDMKGVILISPFFQEDNRGSFLKTYEVSEFEENGIVVDNGEDIVSYSHKGVLRGLHFQSTKPQDKLVRVLKGSVYDVVVDLRKNSSTFGQWRGFTLSDYNKLQVYIPKGFAHGYLALTDDVIFSYKCGEIYYPEYDSGIIWNDRDISVDWPYIDNIILSEKDVKLKTFKEFVKEIGGL